MNKDYIAAGRKATGLLFLLYGRPFFRRRGWDVSWPQPFPDRVHHGLPGGIFSGQSGQRGWLLLEFLRGKHVRHHAGADAAWCSDSFLERSKPCRLDYYGSARAAPAPCSQDLASNSPSLFLTQMIAADG